MSTAAAESTSRDQHAKLLPFLTDEFARTEGRQCVGVELLYAPGAGYRDEEIRSWLREEEPALFENPLYIEKLVSKIIEIAEGETDAKAVGKHRFVVRTRQHLGGRAVMSFVMRPPYVGDSADLTNEEKPMATKPTKTTNKTSTPDADDDRPLSPRKRKRLLARVAGNVAAGIVQAPSESSGSADAIAEISVDIAESILQKIGL